MVCTVRQDATGQVRPNLTEQQLRNREWLLHVHWLVIGLCIDEAIAVWILKIEAGVAEKLRPSGTYCRSADIRNRRGVNLP